MRLGKRERALLKLQTHNRKVMQAKARAVPHTAGVFASSNTRLINGDVITGSARHWEYNGKTARKLTSKGRKY